MPIRIIVSTSEDINSRKKPGLLRRFEKFIKKEIDESLQILHEEKKDLNKIRRLLIKIKNEFNAFCWYN